MKWRTIFWDLNKKVAKYPFYYMKTHRKTIWRKWTWHTWSDLAPRCIHWPLRSNLRAHRANQQQTENGNVCDEQSFSVSAVSTKPPPGCPVSSLRLAAISAAIPLNNWAAVHLSVFTHHCTRSSAGPAYFGPRLRKATSCESNTQHAKSYVVNSILAFPCSEM